MDRTVECEHLLKLVPSLVGSVWRDGVSSKEGLAALLTEAGLASDSEDDTDGPYWWVRVQVDGVDDEQRCERRLRTAVSRAVGKAVGSDKHWDLGSYDFNASFRRGELTLRFAAKFSLAVLRAAARDWLNGAAGVPWLLTHGFIDPETQPKDTGFWPKPAGFGRATLARQFPDGTVRASLFLDASAKPPGTIAASDDIGYQSSLAYLAESLGEPDNPSPLVKPVWSQGNRKFSFYRMRSRARSMEFSEVADTSGPDALGTSR